MFNSHLCATDNLNNLYFLDSEMPNPKEGSPIPAEPMLNLGFSLTSIQNFTYKGTNYLVGTRNYPDCDSIVMIDLSAKKVVKETKLEFKI